MKQFPPTVKGTIWAVYSIMESSEALLHLLDKKELYHAYLQSVTSESRKREWLAVRVLLKNMLQEEKEILYHTNGKPYLADYSYHISISHTKGYAAIALNKVHPVGIDIEYLSSRAGKSYSRFMSSEEYLQVSPENMETQLLLHWSAKESLFKILGEAHVDFKSCLHISPFQLVLGNLSSFPAHETKTEANHAYTVHYLANEAYVLTLAEEI
ncbi:MAG: 4'-phosphopantetheinyl transferase superfamily protein [Dysgonamonadaceae bacterium]|jgi:phosphopantetheinyl transferase|nr:4'-phosphopantetheinyl transferase superfamily protein [Dysgonamonadaceae bacterium]